MLDDLDGVFAVIFTIMHGHWDKLNFDLWDSFL